MSMSASSVFSGKADDPLTLRCSSNLPETGRENQRRHFEKDRKGGKKAIRNKTEKMIQGQLRKEGNRKSTEVGK